MTTPLLLFLYGIFLIGCGITAVSFIGSRAKTALISGGTSGTVAILIGHFSSKGIEAFYIAGMLLAFALFCVFSWRCTKTLQTIVSMIPSQSAELNGKVIAFLIIGLMAIVSIFVLLLQILAYANAL